MPAIAHHIIPSDAAGAVDSMRRVLGMQFEPLATWARDWSAASSCPREYTRQQWWGAAWGQAQRKALLAGSEGRDVARLSAQDGGLGSAWMQVNFFDPEGG